MSLLRAESLGKEYRKRRVVSNLSLEVRSGEVVGLLGPNGAGKTTAFYMIVGLVPCDEGRIWLDDREVTGLPMYRRARLGLGYLPQEASVFRKLTVEDNIRPILEVREDLDDGVDREPRVRGAGRLGDEAGPGGDPPGSPEVGEQGSAAANAARLAALGKLRALEQEKRDLTDREAARLAALRRQAELEALAYRNAAPAERIVYPPDYKPRDHHNLRATLEWETYRKAGATIPPVPEPELAKTEK